MEGLNKPKGFLRTIENSPEGGGAIERGIFGDGYEVLGSWCWCYVVLRWMICNLVSSKSYRVLYWSVN